MVEPTPLRLLQEDHYDYTENYEDLQFFAEHVNIPEEFIDDLTGCVLYVIDGEVEEIYFTESSRPFELAAIYYEPDYWIDDEEEVWSEETT